MYVTYLYMKREDLCNKLRKNGSKQTSLVETALKHDSCQCPKRNEETATATAATGVLFGNAIITAL